MEVVYSDKHKLAKVISCLGSVKCYATTFTNWTVTFFFRLALSINIYKYKTGRLDTRFSDA